MKAITLIFIFDLVCILGCEKEIDPDTTSATVTDLDGNTYETITLGTQV